MEIQNNLKEFELGLKQRELALREDELKVKKWEAGNHASEMHNTYMRETRGRRAGKGHTVNQRGSPDPIAQRISARARNSDFPWVRRLAKVRLGIAVCIYVVRDPRSPIADRRCALPRHTLAQTP